MMTVKNDIQAQLTPLHQVLILHHTNLPPMETKKYEVAVFEKETDCETVLESGLSIEKAEVMATELWNSKKHKYVEILDCDPEVFETIVWINGEYII